MMRLGRAVVVKPARSLRRNFSSALVGNLVYTLSQFGMLVVLARLTTTLDVGRYALALAIAAPIFLLSNLKLRQVQVTDATGINVPGEFIALRGMSSGIGLAVVAAITAVGDFSTQTALTILGVGVFKALESQIDILYGAMQRREQMQLVARGQVLRGVGGLVVFTLTLLLTGRVDVTVAALTAFTLTQVVVNVLQVRALGVAPRPVFAWSRLWRLAVLALPLGLTVAVGSLSVNVPRYFLQMHGDTAALGIYAALAYPLVGLGMVAAALAEAASPRLSNLYAEGRVQAFRSTLRKLVLTGIALGGSGIIGALVLGEPLLELAFGAEYAEQYLVLVVLACAGALQYATVFLGTSVNAMRLFAVQLPIHITGFAAVAAAAFFAVPAWGLIGAAMAIVAGQAVQSIWYLWLLFRVVLPRLAAVEP